MKALKAVARRRVLGGVLLAVCFLAAAAKANTLIPETATNG